MIMKFHSVNFNYPPILVELLSNSMFYELEKRRDFYRSSKNTDKIDIHVTPFAPWGGKKLV